jgi:hypothetical protein
LLAADPSDERLLDVLKRTSLSYDEYLDQLELQGFHVKAADSGYLVEDGKGNRFHECYRLQAVRNPNSQEPVWTGTRGEKLRASLNRHLGCELVQSGPIDEWEHRNNNNVARLLGGLDRLMIRFGPDEHIIDNALSIRDLSVKSSNSRWPNYWPPHPYDENE